MRRVVVHLEYLLVAIEGGAVSHGLGEATGVLADDGGVAGEAFAGQLVPACEGELAVVGLAEGLEGEAGDGPLDQPRALLAQQQPLHLRRPVPVLPLDVPLEDVVVVAQTHLPVGVHVVLEQLLLLGVGHHQHPPHRPLQQRRVPAPRALTHLPARSRPELLVLPVELQVSLVPGQGLTLVLLQLRQHALPLDRRPHGLRQLRQAAALLQMLEALLARAGSRVLLAEDLGAEMGGADEVVGLVFLLGELLDEGQADLLGRSEDVGGGQGPLLRAVGSLEEGAHE